MENVGLRKGMWTPQEDILLTKCIDSYGEGKWHLVPLRAGLNRCRKSCRLRWLNYLKPTIKRGQFTKDEVDLIIRLHKLLGNRWSLIAGRLPGRTGNDVKNFWNSHIEKKLPPEEGRATAHKSRPRPRTFSKEQAQAQAQAQAQTQASSPSSSDDCITWWASLLHISAQDDHTDMVAAFLDRNPNPIAFQNFDHHTF